MNATRVEDLYKECLRRDSDHEPTRGIVLIGFLDVSDHRKEIAAMLDQLPPEFHTNWGTSFLSLGLDKHGEIWTGFHLVKDMLLVLGLAAGYITLFPEDRKEWKLLPGGLPLVRVDTKSTA